MIQPVTITTNVWEVGAVKTGAKFCSRVRKESVSSMGQLPCLGDFSETKTVCQEIARKPTCFFAQSPLFQKCETRTEDVRLFDGFGLTLTHLILSGRPLTPREQALILRLIYRQSRQVFASRVWKKWGKIAECNPEEAVAEASRTVEEEMSRRGLDVSAVLNLQRHVDVESLEHCDPPEDGVET